MQQVVYECDGGGNTNENVVVQECIVQIDAGCEEENKNPITSELLGFDFLPFKMQAIYEMVSFLDGRDTVSLILPASSSQPTQSTKSEEAVADTDTNSARQSNNKNRRRKKSELETLLDG